MHASISLVNLAQIAVVSRAQGLWFIGPEFLNERARVDVLATAFQGFKKNFAKNIFLSIANVSQRTQSWRGQLPNIVDWRWPPSSSLTLSGSSMQSVTGFLSLSAWLHTQKTHICFLFASKDLPHYSAYHSPYDCDHQNRPKKGQIYSVWINSRGLKSWVTPWLVFSFSLSLHRLILRFVIICCRNPIFSHKTIIPHRKITITTWVLFLLLRPSLLMITLFSPWELPRWGIGTWQHS